MTFSEARRSIERGPQWTLVMLFPDGEFGAVDASTRVAEGLMQTQLPFVVGIYRRTQARFLKGDVERAAGPAWSRAA